MKRSIQKKIDDVLNKITHLTRHIRNVEDNCVLLGNKLIESGEIELGKQLISNGFVHDASKFSGIEFEFLTVGAPIEEENAKLKLKLAIHHHQCTNSHHPESWAAGIHDMPDVYLAEMACDWKSRSEEFGTNLREWVDDFATVKWGFSKTDEVYKKITRFVDLLCNKPFEEIK
jgi:hypothetical protein